MRKSKEKKTRRPRPSATCNPFRADSAVQNHTMPFLISPPSHACHPRISSNQLSIVRIFPSSAFTFTLLARLSLFLLPHHLRPVLTHPFASESSLRIGPRFRRLSSLLFPYLFPLQPFLRRCVSIDVGLVTERGVLSISMDVYANTHLSRNPRDSPSVKYKGAWMPDEGPEGWETRIKNIWQRCMRMLDSVCSANRLLRRTGWNPLDGAAKASIVCTVRCALSRGG